MATVSAPAGLPPEAIEFAGRMYNAAREGREDVLSQALGAGLPPNLTNEKGDTLLMLAAYHGHASVVRTLISHNADPNRLNDRGQSPLSGAVFKLEDGVIEALLEGGADPDYGQPNAIDCVRMFNQQEKWLAHFEAAPGRGKMAREHPDATAAAPNGNGVAVANGEGNPGDRVVASGQAPRTEGELEDAYRSR